MLDEQSTPFARMNVIHRLREDPAVARRMHPRLAAWLQRWLHGHGPRSDGTLRIPWSQVKAIGVDVRVDLIADGTPARAWEEWLRDHVVRRLPGAE